MMCVYLCVCVCVFVYFLMKNENPTTKIESDLKTHTI